MDPIPMLCYLGRRAHLEEGRAPQWTRRDLRRFRRSGAIARDQGLEWCRALDLNVCSVVLQKLQNTRDHVLLKFATALSNPSQQAREYVVPEDKVKPAGWCSGPIRQAWMTTGKRNANEEPDNLSSN
jgi:hypothetical protein